jgi:hypothetical protein
MLHAYDGRNQQSHYTGKERDTESGNDYFGARYFASSMGRFLWKPGTDGMFPHHPKLSSAGGPEVTPGRVTIIHLHPQPLEIPRETGAVSIQCRKGSDLEHRPGRLGAQRMDALEGCRDICT